VTIIDLGALPKGKILRKDIYFAQTGYHPHQGQKVVHFNNIRHRVLVNGRRWGKTLCGGKEIEADAWVKNFLGEAKRGWIIGPQYQDAEKEFRVVYDSFKAMGVDQISSKFLSNVENGNMHIKTRWGFDLECRSAAHPETLTGEGLDFVLIAEAGRQKRKMWGDYVRPALSDKRGWSFMSGVPEDATDNSLLYSMFHRGQDISKRTWWSIRMPSWTNTVAFPGGRNDPEILEAEDDLTEDEFARQYEAKFVDKVGRVMKEWDDDDHIVDISYNRKWPLYAATDYGYTNDWVWLWIQVDEFNNVYVIGEHRWQLKDTEEIARELVEHPLMTKLLMIYGPPAEPDDNNVLKRILGKTVRANTGGEIKVRNAMIRSALKLRPSHLPDGHPEKKPALVVDRSCTKLAWEMRTGYRWPENKSEIKSDSEVPVDKDNHGPEALGRFYKGHMEKFDETRKARQSTLRHSSRATGNTGFRRR
jgi:hypothetical protein